MKQSQYIVLLWYFLAWCSVSWRSTGAFSFISYTVAIFISATVAYKHNREDIYTPIVPPRTCITIFIIIIQHCTVCCCAISKAKMKYECLRLCVYSPPIHVLLLASGLNPSAHSQDCFRQTYALARQSLVVRHRPFSSGKLIFRYVFILFIYIILFYYAHI